MPVLVLERELGGGGGGGGGLGQHAYNGTDVVNRLKL